VEDHTSLEKIPRPNENQALQNNYPNVPPPLDSRLSLLRDWWRLIYQHKLLIVSVVLAVLPVVIIKAYRKKPIYQSTATIEVRAEESSLRPNDIFSHNAYDNIKSEVFIIKSRPLIERTVINLNLDQNPHFLDVNSERSVWEAIAALKGDDLELKQEKDRAAAERVLATENKTRDKPESASKDTSSKNVSSEAERERLAPYVYTLMGNLQVDSVRDTRFLRISFTHTDPEIATNVSNGIANNFIEYNFHNKTQHIASASSWLEDSTRKLKARVEEAEQKLANYSRAHNIFSLEGKESLTTNKLARLHEQATRAESDRILKQSLYDEVRQGRVAQLPEAFTDPKTAELRKMHSDLAVQASQLSVRFGAKHPKLLEIRQQMVTIQEQIDANRSTLAEKLKADFDRAVREEASLKAALARSKSDAVQENQAAIQYSILQQDLETAKALYTEFLNKTSQARMQLAEQYNNVRLIEAAEVPDGPIGPNRRNTILMWLVLSLALGIGLAWLLENLNTTVRSVDDVNAAVQLPVLAAIPALNEDSLSMIRTGLHELKDGRDSTREGSDRTVKSVSPIMLKDLAAADEAYRMLRTSVLLSTAGRPPKTIMITSAQPREGKTTTVINTAIAFTKLKAEVLIIDCDMRRPMIHKLARIEKRKGLSTYLAGGGNISEFIKRTPIPYLSILPCGPVAPNPSELISSETMKEMLEHLSSRYKYILIDSPPLITVTDSMILSTMVDGVVLVARSGKCKSEALRRALHTLSSVRARVLGVILNDLDVREEGYEYYYSSNYQPDNSGQLKRHSEGA
jgi:capsular exopolysaccharide synthesis family protein